MSSILGNNYDTPTLTPIKRSSSLATIYANTSMLMPMFAIILSIGAIRATRRSSTAGRCTIKNGAIPTWHSSRSSRLTPKMRLDPLAALSHRSLPQPSASLFNQPLAM